MHARIDPVEVVRLAAGPELDAIVQDAIFNGIGQAANYSSDIAAAWRVRERMQSLWWDSEDHQASAEGLPYAYIFRFRRCQDAAGHFLARPIEEQSAVSSLDDAPVAICRAAVAAMLAFSNPTSRSESY